MRRNKSRQEKCLDFGLFRFMEKNHTVNHTPKRRMGLPKARSCREAPFRYWVVLYQAESWFFRLDRYIHLVSACRIVGFCHSQQAFINQGSDIYPLEVYPVFQIKHIHYFPKCFWLFAEIQNQRSFQVLLMGFLDGFS